MSHHFILHQFEGFNCSTFQNFSDDLKTLVCRRMVHEVTVKVLAGVKDIQDGRKTVNMIYCLMENFSLGVDFLNQCTTYLAGLLCVCVCVVKRVIEEYIFLKFQGNTVFLKSFCQVCLCGSRFVYAGQIFFSHIISFIIQLSSYRSNSSC